MTNADNNNPGNWGTPPNDSTGPMPHLGGPYGEWQSQQPMWQGQPMSEPPVAQSTDPAGFFKALFDFSFSHFVTPKVVKFIYVIAMVLITLTWLVLLFSAFANGDGTSIVIVLVLGPLLGLLYLTFIRMTLEFYLATVRMSEDIHNRLR